MLIASGPEDMPGAGVYVLLFVWHIFRSYWWLILGFVFAPAIAFYLLGYATKKDEQRNRKS